MTLAQLLILMGEHNRVHRPADRPAAPKVSGVADLVALAAMRRRG